MGRKRRIHIPDAFVHVSQKCLDSAMLLIDEEDKPDWRERAAKIKWLNPNREKANEVRHNLKDLVKKLHEKGFRSWKLEVEQYSMLCRPHLSVVV